MPKCSYCRQRKAKRTCPALGSPLCPLCCGKLREKELHCPPACPYLSTHRSYQESKVIRKKRIFSAEVLKDERLAWLVLNIEAPLYGYGERHPGFTDREAILALEYAKDRVNKSPALILTDREGGRVLNEAGEIILRSLNLCRFQRKIILPQALGSYTTEEKIKCLDNIILAVQHLSQGRLEERTYLQDLGRRLAQLGESPGSNKIITPT